LQRRWAWSSYWSPGKSALASTNDLNIKRIHDTRYLRGELCFINCHTQHKAGIPENMRASMPRFLQRDWLTERGAANGHLASRPLKSRKRLLVTARALSATVRCRRDSSASFGGAIVSAKGARFLGHSTSLRLYTPSDIYSITKTPFWSESSLLACEESTEPPRTLEWPEGQRCEAPRPGPQNGTALKTGRRRAPGLCAWRGSGSAWRARRQTRRPSGAPVRQPGEGAPRAPGLCAWCVRRRQAVERADTYSVVTSCVPLRITTLRSSPTRLACYGPRHEARTRRALRFRCGQRGDWRHAHGESDRASGLTLNTDFRNSGSPIASAVLVKGPRLNLKPWSRTRRQLEQRDS
jgi:hypothetical protein